MASIKDILKKDEYDHLAQFTDEDKKWIDDQIQTRKDGELGVECIIRGKNDDGDYFKLTPEEVVRQYYTYLLLKNYGYTSEQIEFEVPAVYAGKEVIKDKRIDITVFNKEDRSKIDMIIEVKRPEIKDENLASDGESTTPFQQMQSYCRLKLPKIGVIANGDNLLKFYEGPAFDEPLTIDKFPQNGEDIEEWKENRRFTLKQLMQADRLQTETLKDIILNVEQRFGANDSSDKAFEEIFKLIFIKLYDEVLSSTDADVIANDMNRHHIALGIDFGNKFVINKNEEALIELVRTHDCLLEDDNYLLPSDWILTLLKGRLKFDYMHRRYVVVDQDNRTIFVIKKWSSCYMGDNDYTGDAIPLYSGVHIYATCEALNTIKTKIDGLSRRIFVDSFSQNY